MAKRKDPKTFTERIHKEILPVIKFPKKSKISKELSKRFMASLLGERLPDDHIPLVKTTPKQKYIMELFNRYNEIHESLDRFKLIVKFVTTLPRRKDISHLEYLKYHNEFFLNEVYIFKMRIDSLLDFLIKKSKKYKLPDQEKELKRIKLAVGNGLKHLIDIRGSHVHIKRYKTDKLDQLQLLNSLSDQFDFMKAYGDMETKGLHKKILTHIKETQSNFEKFVDVDLYEAIKDIAFNKLIPKSDK